MPTFTNIQWTQTAATTASTSTSTATTNANIVFSTNAYAYGKLISNPNPQPDPQRPPREFNKYLNSSDLLEEFIKWLGTQGVKQREVMTIPLEIYIKWLVIRTCEEDNEPPTIEMPALSIYKQRRCLGCGQFMIESPIQIHEHCTNVYFSRLAIAQ